MQEENRNDKASWKLRLQDLPADENFNKNAAWDKLYIKSATKICKGKSNVVLACSSNVQYSLYFFQFSYTSK